jgi:hypothetical protein
MTRIVRVKEHEVFLAADEKLKEKLTEFEIKKVNSSYSTCYGKERPVIDKSR